MISLIRCKKSQVDSITLETDFEDSWFAWLSPLHANEEGKKGGGARVENNLRKTNHPHEKTQKKGRGKKKEAKLGPRAVTFISSA